MNEWKTGMTPNRKAGRPLDSERHMTLTATKPWAAAGMSRRTWYRRQRSDWGCPHCGTEFSLAADAFNPCGYQHGQCKLDPPRPSPINPRRGRPLKGEEPRPKPWIELGVSESTWRRRQKVPRKTADHWRRAP